VDEICHTEHIVRNPPATFTISGLFKDLQNHMWESYAGLDYVVAVPASLSQFLPVQWSATGLPANLTIVSTGPNRARVSGCLNTMGVFPITIHAKLGPTTVDAPTFTLTIKQPSQTIPCP